MSFFKVNYKGRVLIDLSEDDVSSENLHQGIRAHDNKGNLIVGSANTYENGVLDGRNNLLEELPIMIQEHLTPLEDSEYYSSNDAWLLEETNKYITIENTFGNLAISEEDEQRNLIWQGTFAFLNKNTNLSISLLCDINITVTTADGLNNTSNAFSTTIEIAKAHSHELNITQIVEENTSIQDLEGCVAEAKISIVGIKWKP